MVCLHSLETVTRHYKNHKGKHWGGGAGAIQQSFQPVASQSKAWGGGRGGLEQIEKLQNTHQVVQTFSHS